TELLPRVTTRAPRPVSVAVSPNGAYAYVVTNFYYDNVYAFSINAGTGALTPVPGSPFTADGNATSVALSPNGAYAYVTMSENVSVYSINAGTGALTELPDSPFTAGTNPSAAPASP